MVRELWLVDDELRAAGLYHHEPIVDALVPYFFMHGFTPEELLDHCAWREAYMARYGRIPPSELRDMDPDHASRLLLKVSELIKAEFAARAGANPLDPGTEDASE